MLGSYESHCYVGDFMKPTPFYRHAGPPARKHALTEGGAHAGGAEPGSAVLP